MIEGERVRRPADTSRGIVSIRSATAADLATVVALRLALVREHGGNEIYRRLRADAPERAQQLFATQLASRTEITLLAERDGDPAGILRCVDTAGSPLLYPSHFGYVSSVYVVPGMRRGGVLRALLARAESWCHDRGLREMRLHNAFDNELANQAWTSLGFEPVEMLRMRRLDRG